ncbi:MAG TPA: hypothetical protein VE152_05150 [Acidimicrobiales bacterium]|jgi:hypothetical protein|nr:hypothetical protein [Acidimicrobiales bacterium]
MTDGVGPDDPGRVELERQEDGAGPGKRRVPPAKHCGLYIPGHTVHFIQAKRSSREEEYPPASGEVTGMEGNMITVALADGTHRYRNHEVPRLAEILGGTTGPVVVQWGLHLLKVAGDRGSWYCFAIADADEPWRPCDSEPLGSADPRSVVERLLTHGGVMVPGPETPRPGAEGADC